MPIKGLSEQRRLPRVGKIHLGVKTQNKQGVEYPSATDYFVCPPEIQAVYGDKPKELNVMIPVEDEEYWANQYYRAYSRTRGLTCKGDGEKCNRMVDTKTGEMANRDSKEVVWKPAVCEGQECPYYENKQCREVMNLQFLLPEVPGLGVWQIDTSSPNSIRNINSFAELIRGVCGHIRMIPLVLSLEAEEKSDPSEGKKRNVFILHLRHGQSLLKLLTDSTKPVLELLAPPPVEDEAPRDEPVVVEPDIKQAEKDVDNMFPPDPKHAAEAAVKPPPKVGSEPTEVIESEAIETTKEEAQSNSKSIIALDWLKEQLETLVAKGQTAYTEESLLSYMRSSYKGVKGDTVLEIASNLDKGRAAHFTKVIQDALDKA